jgi:hypothetical protein
MATLGRGSVLCGALHGNGMTVDTVAVLVGTASGSERVGCHVSRNVAMLPAIVTDWRGTFDCRVLKLFVVGLRGMDVKSTLIHFLS